MRLGPVGRARWRRHRRRRRVPAHRRRGLRLHRGLDPVRRRLRPLPAGRQLPRWARGLAAGLGLFVSTTVLMIVGAASVSATAAAGISSDNPTTAFVGVLPGVARARSRCWRIALGAVAANVLNVYSGAMAFLSHRAWTCRCSGPGRGRGRRSAWSGSSSRCSRSATPPPATRAFLLVDRLLDRAVARRGAHRPVPAPRPAADRAALRPRVHATRPGVIALLVGHRACRCALFSNQVLFVGLVPRLVPGVGDVTFLVGIALSAAGSTRCCSGARGPCRVSACCGADGLPRRVSS